MKKFLAISTALVVSLSASQAFAGGWGKSGYGVSSGLLNVSPNINLGGVNALNGIGVLNGSPILSGNGILNGNANGILNGNGVLSGIGLNGVLSGIGLNILGPNKSGGHGGHHRKRR